MIIQALPQYFENYQIHDLLVIIILHSILGNSELDYAIYLITSGNGSMNVNSQMSAGRRSRLFVNDTNISTFSSRLTQSHQCALSICLCFLVMILLLSLAPLTMQLFALVWRQQTQTHKKTRSMMAEYRLAWLYGCFLP